MILIGEHLNNCLLPIAKPSAGEYFRLIPSGKLCIDEFKSRARLCIEGNGYLNVDLNVCEEHALSLCTTMERVFSLKRKFKRYRLAKVAVVNLLHSHGVINQDTPAHANWWHPINFDPLTIATLANEESK